MQTKPCSSRLQRHSQQRHPAFPRITSQLFPFNRRTCFSRRAPACRLVAMPASRNSRLAILAFREPGHRQPDGHPSRRNMAVSEHVSVPVDYYRLLQVPRVSRPDAIRKSYDNLMKQSPATAYSADTLFARAVLLKAASESLTDPDLRRSYDAKLAAGHTALRVSQQDLPGALVLLQEIGEFQLVLELGSRWLDLNGAQPDAGDVAAAVALSYCDRAGERLLATDSQGAVMPACDDLDAALTRLRRYGVAKQLQTQIVGALRDLAPEYACELASLPLDSENAARRAKGVALMRGVLRAAASAARAVARSGGGMGAAAPQAAAGAAEGDMADAGGDPQSTVVHARRMLTRASNVLTCSEQVSLLPDALRGSGLTPHPDVLYDGALAHIVQGFTRGWPHSVQQADRLLAQMEQQLLLQAQQGNAKGSTAAETGKEPVGAASSSPSPSSQQAQQIAELRGSNHAGGVALERAVCAVLLGDYRAAVSLLGLQQQAQQQKRGAATASDAAAAAAEEEEEAAEAGASREPSEHEKLVEFVTMHSPNAAQGDLRPGLRALAARWLEGVALASFRDTAGQSVAPLEQAWFGNPRVAAYVQVWKLSRNDQVLAGTHFLCNLLPNFMQFLASLAAKVAAVFVAIASRGKRANEGTATAGGRTASMAGTPTGSRASSSAASIHVPVALEQEHQHQEASVSAAGPTNGAMLAATPVPDAAAGMGPSGTSGSNSPEAASPAAVAATVSPFGHPYGKPLRDAAAVELATATVASNSSGLAPAASTFGGPMGRSPQSSRGTSRASTANATASSKPGTRSLTEADSSSVVRHTGDAADMRRRFAASAAVDAAALAPQKPQRLLEVEVEGQASQQHELASDVEEAKLGLEDMEEVEEEDDPSDVPDEEEAEDPQADAALAAPPRRGMTEQDLRAHLAGLEAAMWDSEVPTLGSKPQNVLLWAAALVAMLAALATVLFQRRDTAASASRLTLLSAPTAACFTISAQGPAPGSFRSAC
ncbi:hypothetical protein Agub_g8071 [Astrephomene gubernaculifera]|uniref:J domain-containing protein n=1 Tax=Astrephomene gubernaculifera TaxID=47775 RepID=A0AAD3DTR8_9CHLO|nr:hypothetical protein Agub_g8071 [Astrephomene gubernaculifera]